MRDIKFRGKRMKDGKWIYGAYIPPDCTYWEYPSIADNNHRFEIEPETLGQYTGYKDVDGNEIYEGDVLEVSFFDAESEDRHFRGIVNLCGMGMWEIMEPDASSHLLGSVMGRDFFKAKIIGNIYDNPKLLEEEK